MNNVVSNFPRVLEFAQEYALPLNKKRAIVREYLQSAFISLLYTQSNSKKLSFVGGTSLRLLRGLNRFSEDLDFDNLGLSDEKIIELVSFTVTSLQRENISIELMTRKKENKIYFEIKFPSLLFDLGISTNSKEKITIKVDYSNIWRAQKTETILFSRFGFIEQIVTNTPNVLLVQKITAYVQRKETQPRDIYDTVWLYSQNARFDQEFAKENSLTTIMQQAQEKWSKQGVTLQMKNKLRPFLFQEESIEKMNLFGNVLIALNEKEQILS